MTADGFRALKARQMLKILRHLGYRETRRAGSHRRLEGDGLPSLTFSFHDGAELAPGLVRDILMNDVRLTRQEALEATRRG